MNLIKAVYSGLAAGALMIGVFTPAFAQAPGGGGPGMSVSPGGMKGTVKIHGRVVCAYCDLDTARGQYLELNNLYELRYEQGSVVMQIDSVNSSTERGGQNDPDMVGRWKELTEPPTVAARTSDELFEKLLRPENRLKEVELAGIIRPSRTLDIADITVAGEGAQG